MCGFAGILHRGTDSPAVDVSALTRMRDTMVSRGPDGEGMWLSEDGHLGLVHRRLAVIDLGSGANQPMVDSVTGNVIVFNGEIYNYKALRRECEGRGAVFKTASDTEVLLALYREHGEAMVKRLRGMFAFGLWDAVRRRLFLARDPLGIKPLYYADDGKAFRFASQVKALIAGGVPDSPSAAGIAGFYVWGHVPEPWTWAAAVHALPAGCTLTVSPETPPAEPRRYFDLREEILRAQDSAPPGADAAREAVSCIMDSVRHHLVADVPVGVFLSAGRDSTLIAALATRAVQEPLRTLTLGFNEFRGRPADEVPVAERVAAAIGAQHTTARIARQDFESERARLLAAMDQPSIDGVNTYFVSRAAAAAGLKVALSGLGGDELFGGYPSFTQVPRLASILRVLGFAPWFGRAVRAVSAPLATRLGKPKLAGLLEYGASVPRAYLLRRALFMPWELPRVMDPPIARAGLEELALDEDLRARVAGIRNPVLAVMALEMSCYMANQLLRDADWAGMAHSLEIRVPLVDVELLRQWLPLAAHRLPFDRQRLLETADPAVAKVTGVRPKTGFSIPVSQWLREIAGENGRLMGLRPWAVQVARRFAPASRTVRAKILLTDAFGGIGGIAKFNRDWIHALAAMPECRGIEVFPRLVQRDPEPVPAKVRYRFDAARGKWAYVLAVLRSVWSGPRPNVLICGHLNLLPLAWLVGQLERCPVIVITHGIEAWTPHRSLLVRALLPRAGRVVSVSRFTAEKLSSWSGVPPQHIAVLPNCIDLEAFQPRARSAEVEQRYGLQGKRVLLTVGRIVRTERYKGFDEVLEVLPGLLRQFPDLVYVIVGDGDDRARLRQKAADLGLAGHTVFTGYVSEEEKKDLYATADVFVMPGRGEGFGIVYLEAMAMGVPVIASKKDGSREAVREGELGAMVDPDSPEDLQAAIAAALELPRRRPAGLEFFSEQAYRERVISLVREVAA